jgi:hydrogenase expression/formation protein HypC
MCLAIPMEIIEIDGNYATALAKGVRTNVNIALAPDLKIHDKVLVHAGFVIEKLDEQTAKEIEDTWNEYMSSLEDGNVQ